MVMGVGMAIVAPNVGRRMQEREVRSSALGLAAAARDLRSRAMLDGVAQQLTVSMPLNSYLVAKKHEVHLPSDVRFTSIAGGQTVDRETKKFYFFPNGSSLGGEIVVADSNDAAISYLIRMEPLTGRIEVARGGNS